MAPFDSIKKESGVVIGCETENFTREDSIGDILDERMVNYYSTNVNGFVVVVIQVGILKGVDLVPTIIVRKICLILITILRDVIENVSDFVVIAKERNKRNLMVNSSWEEMVVVPIEDTLHSGEVNPTYGRATVKVHLCEVVRITLVSRGRIP